MEQEELFKKLKQIAEKIMGESFDDATPASLFKEDLGMDSISVLYMVMAIEKDFGVRFDNKSLDTFKSVQDVMNYIEKSQTK